MRKNALFYTLLILSSFTPIVTYGAFAGVTGLLTAFKGVLKITIPIIFGLAIIYFFWGTAQFILHAGDAKTRDDGKQKMFWGVIALFVMFSIYGILNWIGTQINIMPGSGNTQPPPSRLQNSV